MKTRKLTIAEYELPITIREEKSGGYSAQSLAWDDCYAQGETFEEVITEISYVAASLIELYQEENLTIPLKLTKTAKKNARSFNLNIPVIISTN